MRNHAATFCLLFVLLLIGVMQTARATPPPRSDIKVDPRTTITLTIKGQIRIVRGSIQLYDPLDDRVDVRRTGVLPDVGGNGTWPRVLTAAERNGSVADFMASVRQAVRAAEDATE